ncbi:MAG: hypothetical protein GY822_13845 [Deltaproteobacteria bacterium]|nr:hypothetical protein [Deltaproteobacteria bacterium]
MPTLVLKSLGFKIVELGLLRFPTDTFQRPLRPPTDTFPRPQLEKIPLVIPAMGPSALTIAASTFGILALILGVGLGMFLQSRSEGQVPKFIRYVDGDGGDVVVAA